MIRLSFISISHLRSLALLFLLAAGLAGAQTPSPALLVLEKADNTLAIVDPSTLKIVGRVPAGPDPHEIEASPDGKLAYISNYGGSDSELHTISVVDLAAQKALSPIDLGSLRSPHGLAFAGGKLYFTAETSKVVGRFGPPPGAPAGSAPPPGPPPGAPRKTWRITNVPAGRGSEGFDLSPDGKQIWAANAQEGTVTIIDVATKKAPQTFPISVRGNRLKFTLDGKQAFVSGGLGGSSKANVAILDVATHKELKSFNLGGGSAGILMAPDGSRAFVAVSAKNEIVAIDLKTLEFTIFSTGKNPDGLAWATAK